MDKSLIIAKLAKDNKFNNSSSGYDDMSVEISTDGGTTWSAPITGKEFVQHCEAGDYTTVGTMARITNLNTNKVFRVILIGINHDSLYNTEGNTVYAKTTWHFYNVMGQTWDFGLPFNFIDYSKYNAAYSGKVYTNKYLNGTNETEQTLTHSNKGGYPTAVGLHNALHLVFSSLPITLQAHIKPVLKNIYIPRNSVTIGANGSSETDESRSCIMIDKLFLLSAREAGVTKSSLNTYEGSPYAYLTSNARRIRYRDDSTPAMYLLRTPDSINSYLWSYISNDGKVDTGPAGDGFIVPAFCI